MEDILESNDRSSRPSDPLDKYLAPSEEPKPSKSKKSKVPSTFIQSQMLKSNYDKATTFMKVVLVVLIASLILAYILMNPSSPNQEYDYTPPPIERKTPHEEKPIETYTPPEEHIREEIPSKKPTKGESYFNHFKWLTLENLCEQQDLEPYLVEKTHKEFQPFSFEKEIEQTREKYGKILNSSEFYRLNLVNPEELEKKIDQFLALKKNLSLNYEKAFHLTNEVLKAMQEYSICRTGVFSEKDRLTNISLENEKSTMMIRRYKEEIEEMDRLLNSQLSDTQSLLNRYEGEKRKLQAQLNEKQKELNRLKLDPERLGKELEEIRRILAEVNGKDKLLIEIKDNSDEIERIKRRMRQIETDKEEVLSNIDFLNKKLKSYDNIAKVGENFKSLSTNDAPKILLEKLKYLQKEYNERPSSRKNMKSRIEDTKKEYIDSMHGSINSKKHLKLDESSAMSANAVERENYKRELNNLEKEYEELRRRLAFLENNIEKKKKQYADWDKRHDDNKRKEMDKEAILAELAKRIGDLEREIDDLHLQIHEKERIIDQIKSQPKIDPALINSNKRELKEKIAALERIVEQKKIDFNATLKKINNQIKECQIKYHYSRELMERKKVVDDFMVILGRLLELKEELRRKMKNYVDNI